MNDSEPEWVNHKQITSQVISGIVPTDAGHIHVVSLPKKV